MVVERVPVELGVPRTIDLPHAAFADLGGDGVWAEGGAGLEAHGVSPLDGGLPLSDGPDGRVASNAAPRATPIAIPRPTLSNAAPNATPNATPTPTEDPTV